VHTHVYSSLKNGQDGNKIVLLWVIVLCSHQGRRWR